MEIKYCYFVTLILYFQCKVAAAMVAASTSASYSSVSQYDGTTTTLPTNRSIMGRRHLNSCSSCDSCSNSICTAAESKLCQSGHHFHHTRRPAMRQNKRCTFATSMSVSANKNGGPPTNTIVNLPVTNNSASIRLVPQPTHSFYRGGVGTASTVVSTAATSHLLQSEYRLPRTMLESPSSNHSPIVVVVSTHSPMYPLPNTIVQSASCLSVSSSSSDMSSVSASIQAND